MYCKKCGKKMKDNKTYCDYCGQGKEDIVLTGDEKKDAARQMDYGSIGAMCIVMSCIPMTTWIAIIMSIIYLCTMRKNTTMGNKELGKKRFIISIIISAAWGVIPMLIGIVSLILVALKLKV
jgi:uncharacterized membrane protein YvbJ